MDDHSFCEVAVVEDGELRSAGRVETKPEALELFAQSSGVHDNLAGGTRKARNGGAFIRVELAGLEPATSWVRSRRSPN